MAQKAMRTDDSRRSTCCCEGQVQAVQIRPLCIALKSQLEGTLCEIQAMLPPIGMTRSCCAL
eukprot:CAMPEP_0206480372 /NCGR_PEP_ID=MMETSP0324_2-20121206/37264_1 /ASSEMBLY_ACC=CAM_ASM_000836 /TAXON_ID=2866 /ORGANISM="Crypthecodinium cohnii, Strain Seligo" /LENGTH=61 /DNA_ID=CAMNT_0053957165 /DNA_START=147 /DNA_END=329 /DNA_ORIENTATION=-